ncbi:Histidine kinase [Rhodovastum atsumiense]|uniref:histidine kinase n=1 Tax=Rhodovastum atsumiense TaxID=504468 RepID=A0A5M6IUL7_9PROT|nr:PAS domain S-box protein [Rhodovastum atsumiense]KAA5611248.1 PAS domain S-box protein [Rhodovastum atsumiense]CAH2603984.1 Histidine kinase [Rhodovastum atsumiense]
MALVDGEPTRGPEDNPRDPRGGAADLVGDGRGRTRYIAGVAFAYAGLAAAWLLFSNRLLMEVGNPALVAWLAAAQDGVFVVVSSVLVALALRGVPSQPPPAHRQAMRRRAMRRPWALLGAFALVTLIVSAMALLVYHAALTSLQRNAVRQVQAVARLKATGVENWMVERRAEAAALGDDPFLAAIVARGPDRMDTGQAGMLARALAGLGAVKGVRGAALLSATGGFLLGTSLLPDDPALQAAVRAAVRTRRVTLLDLHRDADGSLHFGYVAPIRPGQDGGASADAVVLLDLDPAGFLFPYLQTWPLPGRTGQSLLWRSEGGARVLLSQPRGEADQFGLRWAPSSDGRGGGRPVPAEEDGRMHPDFRGVPVIAADATVAGTPWLVVAQQDDAETLPDLRRLVGVIVLVALAILAASLGAVAVLWQRQRLRMAFAEIERGRALMAAETRFRATFEQAAVGIAHVGLNGRILRANRRMAETVGQAPEHLPGLVLAEMIGPDDPAAASLLPLMAAGRAGSCTYERRLEGPEGCISELLVTVSLVRAAEAEPDYFVVVTQDVTARKQAEAALRRSEQRFRKIFDASPLGIAILAGPERRIEQANRAMRAMLGYAAAEMVGRPASQLLPAGDPVGSAAHPPDTFAAGSGPGAVDRCVVTKSGRAIWIRISRARFDEPGDPSPSSSLLLVVEDVTERRALEAALRQAQRLEAVSQLTGGVAHDFNNLLNVIMLEAEALGGLPEGDPPTLRPASEILNAAQRGAELTRRLLAFARQQPLRAQMIDLVTLLPDVAELLRRTLGGNIEVGLVVAAGLWPTEADASQLQDALLNLAINARDAMPQGGRLDIAATNARLDALAARAAELAPGDYVALSVADTGSGMAPEVLERAMEPFFTTKPPGAGTGLGLSMIYGFVRQSGGQLELASAPGQGTTVRLLLPRAAAGVTALASTAEGQAMPPPSGRGHILLVDDNAALRQVLTRQLTALGYQVHPAGSGMAALAVLRGGARFDLLFTDEVMPEGMSGSALAAVAREIQPGLKVLFTSGFLHLAEGLADRHPVLPKPYRLADLAAKLRDAMAA